MRQWPIARSHRSWGGSRASATGVPTGAAAARSGARSSSRLRPACAQPGGVRASTAPLRGRPADVASFEPLRYPHVFDRPRGLTDVDSWHTHIPFAFFAVAALEPRTIVELGTWKGDSYCALCQAVQAVGLPTRCYAVDTWRGDEHTGAYGPDVL